MKITFKHDTDCLSEAFGISKKRMEEIYDVVACSMAKFEMGSRTSECIEDIIGKMKSNAEVVYAVYTFGRSAGSFDSRITGFAEGLKAGLYAESAGVSEDIKKSVEFKKKDGLLMR